jgi:uncharacterized protein YceH (UPF0502 family)
MRRHYMTILPAHSTIDGALAEFYIAVNNPHSSPKRGPGAMNELTAIQVRVLGCLMEKKETTPDQYPLTLNALRNACNQKTSRFPVTAYTEGEVGHTIRELEELGLVREHWGARVPKYEHLAGKVLGLHSRGIALLCTLMLRGPQTLGELKSHSQRLFEFDDLDDVAWALDKLQQHEPPLAMALPRRPGQKEGRYAQLVSGEPDLSQVQAVNVTPARTGSGSELEARVAQLESELQSIKARLAELTGVGAGD